MSILRVLAKECVDSDADQNDDKSLAQPFCNEPLVQRERFENTGTLRKRKEISSSIPNTMTTENIELSSRAQTTQQKSPTVTEHEEYMISWRRILLLIMAVTVHNIPEGKQAD